MVVWIIVGVEVVGNIFEGREVSIIVGLGMNL